MLFLHYFFLILLVLLSIPVLVFAIQVAISLPAYRNNSLPTIRRPSIAVLVPAHNEAEGIAKTLNAIREQLMEGDRILVVADNCSDDTVVVARTCGAEAVERFETERRGKGYALDFGLRHLASAPPEVVMIVDADCLIHANVLDWLSRMCLDTGHPIQALYLMHSPSGAGAITRVAEFAWIVRGLARPLGYLRLGLPCQLMGSGMAFPWQLIQRADLANGQIVEDMKLGLDLAQSGLAPLFCPDALVTSMFATSEEGEQTQRTRWEHGHLGMILKESPRLLLESFYTLNKNLFALVIDMCVPPLALLTIMVSSLCLLAMAAWVVTGTAQPWYFAFIVAAILVVAILLAWVRLGREILSFTDLVYIPIYALRKVPLYLKFTVRRQIEWVRSKRD